MRDSSAVATAVLDAIGDWTRWVADNPGKDSVAKANDLLRILLTLVEARELSSDRAMSVFMLAAGYAGRPRVEQDERASRDLWKRIQALLLAE